MKKTIKCVICGKPFDKNRSEWQRVSKCDCMCAECVGENYGKICLGKSCAQCEYYEKLDLTGVGEVAQ